MRIKVRVQSRLMLIEIVEACRAFYRRLETEFSVAISPRSIAPSILYLFISLFTRNGYLPSVTQILHTSRKFYRSAFDVASCSEWNADCSPSRGAISSYATKSKSISKTPPTCFVNKKFTVSATWQENWSCHVQLGKTIVTQTRHLLQQEELRLFLSFFISWKINPLSYQGRKPNPNVVCGHIKFCDWVVREEGSV